MLVLLSHENVPERLSLHGLRTLDAREVDQSGTDDEELRSPYVLDNDLDVGRWAHDAAIVPVPPAPWRLRLRGRRHAAHRARLRALAGAARVVRTAGGRAARGAG